MTDSSSQKIAAAEAHHLIAFSCLYATNTSEGVEEQAAQVLSRLNNQLVKVDLVKSNILTVTIYLSDISFKPEMEKAWDDWVHSENAPVHTVVGGVQLVGGANVGMTAIAAAPGHSLQGYGHGHGDGGKSHAHIRRSSEAASHSD